MARGARYYVNDRLRLHTTADDAKAGTSPGSWLHDDKIVSSSTGSTTSTGTPYINDAADYDRWYPAVSIWWMPSTGGSGYAVGWVNDDLNGFALWAKVAGSLRKNKAVYVKSGGTLRKAKAVYAKIGGTLRKAR